MVKPRSLLVACGKEHKKCRKTRDCGYDCDENPAFDHVLIDSGYTQNGQWCGYEMNGVQCTTPVVPIVFIVDYWY